jgi:hypothetical protein
MYLLVLYIRQVTYYWTMHTTLPRHYTDMYLATWLTFTSAFSPVMWCFIMLFPYVSPQDVPCHMVGIHQCILPSSVVLYHALFVCLSTRCTLPATWLAFTSAFSPVVWCFIMLSSFVSPRDVPCLPHGWHSPVHSPQ